MALGETSNLNEADAIKLHDENPNKPSFAKRNSQALRWAYNRRGDNTPTPTGQKSTQFFPGDADETKLLFGSKYQGRRTVERAGEVRPTQPHEVNDLKLSGKTRNAIAQPNSETYLSWVCGALEVLIGFADPFRISSAIVSTRDQFTWKTNHGSMNLASPNQGNVRLLGGWRGTIGRGLASLLCLP